MSKHNPLMKLFLYYLVGAVRNPLFVGRKNAANAWIVSRLKGFEKKYNDDNDFIVDRLEFLPNHWCCSM